MAAAVEEFGDREGGKDRYTPGNPVSNGDAGLLMPAKTVNDYRQRQARSTYQCYKQTKKADCGSI